MAQTEDKIDVIPESTAARLAWRASFIPLVGAALFIPLGFLALFQIGRGRTGFWLLRRGVIAVFLINVIPYFAFYLSGYSGYYHKIYDKAYSYLPKHGVYNTFYENGNKYEQQKWWFGKRDGSYERWHTNGQKAQKGRYHNGKRDGKWISYDLEGLRSEEGTYKNDELDGNWVSWSRHSDSFEKYEGEYKNGQKEGRWTELEFIMNIQKQSVGEYKNGKRTGAWTKWMGEISFAYGLKENHIKDWRKVDRPENLPRQTKKDYWEEGEYKDHYKEGKWTQWHDMFDQKLKEEGEYKYGKKEGKWITTFDNGQKKREGMYKNDNKIGKWKYWDKFGKLSEEEIYNDEGVLTNRIDFKDGQPIEETK